MALVLLEGRGVPAWAPGSIFGNFDGVAFLARDLESGRLVHCAIHQGEVEEVFGSAPFFEASQATLAARRLDLAELFSAKYRIAPSDPLTISIDESERLMGAAWVDDRVANPVL